MNIDTEIEGDPGSIREAARWLTGSLRPAAQRGAQSLKGASSTRGWQGQAADGFGSWAFTAAAKAEVVSDGVAQVGPALTTFATAMTSAQKQMKEIRSTAAGKDLDVSGFLIAHPGTGPARPGRLTAPAGGLKLSAGAKAKHAEAVEAFEEHRRKLEAYGVAQREAEAVRRELDTAAGRMSRSLGVADQKMVKTAVGVTAGRIEAFAVRQPSKLVKQGTEALEAARRAFAETEGIGGRIRAGGDAHRLAQELDGLEEANERVARPFRGFSRLMGVAAYYLDRKDGESWHQAALSQTAAYATGWGVGAVATFYGTPALGFPVGFAASTAADGFVDGVYEQGPARAPRAAHQAVINTEQGLFQVLKDRSEQARVEDPLATPGLVDRMDRSPLTYYREGSNRFWDAAYEKLGPAAQVIPGGQLPVLERMTGKSVLDMQEQATDAAIDVAKRTYESGYMGAGGGI